MNRRDRIAAEIEKRHELRSWLRQEARTSLGNEPLAPAERREIRSRVTGGLAQQSWCHTSSWRASGR